MKMKKGLLSVAFLLATSSALAAMSFSAAEVKSDMSVTVKNTDKALLALTPGDHKAVGINDEGVLEIDLNKGYGGKFGVQNKSKYYWDELFTITNNSDRGQVVAVTGGDYDIYEIVKLYRQDSLFRTMSTGGIALDDTLELTNGKLKELTDIALYYLPPGTEEAVNLEFKTRNQDVGDDIEQDIVVTAFDLETIDDILETDFFNNED